MVNGKSIAYYFLLIAALFELCTERSQTSQKQSCVFLNSAVIRKMSAHGAQPVSTPSPLNLDVCHVPPESPL